MKSPSSSSSSSSCLHNSHGGTAGCFPAIFSRLLCKASGKTSLDIHQAAAPVPGLLARLMGLETLPSASLPEKLPEFRYAGEFLLLSFYDDDDDEEDESFRKPEKKEKKKKKGKSESSMQTSSPVSVLSRSLDLEVEDHTDSSSPISDDEAGTRRKGSSELNYQEIGNPIAGSPCSEDPCSEASLVVEEELQKINWVPPKSEELREIVVELGLRILDDLIHEEAISLKTCNFRPSSFNRTSETLMLEEYEFSVFTMKTMN